MLRASLHFQPKGHQGQVIGFSPKFLKQIIKLFEIYLLSINKSSSPQERSEMMYQVHMGTRGGGKSHLGSVGWRSRGNPTLSSSFLHRNPQNFPIPPPAICTTQAQQPSFQCYIIYTYNFHNKMVWGEKNQIKPKLSK